MQKTRAGTGKLRQPLNVALCVNKQGSLTVSDKEERIKYSKDLDQFIRFAFDDLIEIASTNKELFEALYYNRKNQCDEFYAQMEDNHKAAQNALIIGGAGVGKTSFMHKLKINCNNKKVYTILIDYRKIVPKTTEGLVTSFLSEIEKYFEIIKKPIHTLKNNNTVDQNFQAAFRHLDELTKEEQKKHLVLFLDDFDYAEDEWFELLKYFLPFSNNNKTSLVLSVRPPLLSAIDDYDDRFRSSYIKKARHIVLSPISVENVISTRLAPILIENENTNKLYGLTRKLFNRESSLCILAKKYGAIVDDLPRFEYPLTKKHNTFMQRITSGDLRETFDIAYESLKFIIEHDDYLDEKLEDGIKKRIIGREGVMKTLYDDKESSYKMINLHTFRSKSGNSLFYNVLEAIQYHGIADDRFYSALSSMGHKKNKIDEALNELSSRKHRFFYPSKFIPIKKKRHITYSRKYIPNSKLAMYLEICQNWGEYIERCGGIGNSVEIYL